MKRTVFISHSSQDKKVADAVCNFLEKHGVLCWIAPRDITPGKNYGAAIIDAISECEFFVLILSRLSNDSQQVVREVERAASTQSVVIPLRIEAVQPSKDLEFYVSSSHWLDAVSEPLERHLTELLQAIQGWQKNEGQLRRRSSSQLAPDSAPTTTTHISATVTGNNRRRSWLATLGGLSALGILAAVLLVQRHAHDSGVPLSTPSAVTQISPAPLASSPPTVSAAEDHFKRLPMFLAEFLEKLGGHDANAMLRYFAEPTSYYEYGKVNHSFIREDLERDDRSWPKRSYSLTGEPKFTQSADPNILVVEFPMAYSLTNDRGTSNGLLKMTMHVRAEQGALVIVGVQKQVQAPEKKAQTTPLSPTPIPLNPSADNSRSREYMYSGRVGSGDATFRLRFDSGERVSGTYSQGGSTYRLEGRNPKGKLFLDEYTAERLTAHIELTLVESAGAVRWDGTMHNTPPDNRVFPVSFERSSAELPLSPPPNLTGNSEATAEYTFRGKVGKSDATFQLRFASGGRVTGTYVMAMHKNLIYRLEGRNPRGRLLLDEYTDDRLTAHIELTRQDSDNHIRWEGTMHNTPPDNREFQVFFARTR